MGAVCSCLQRETTPTTTGPSAGSGTAVARKAPAKLRQEVIESFQTFFEGKPTVLGVAPGRAEVVGNHTDYNEGFILAAAIDRYVVVAGRVIEGTTGRVASSKFPGIVEFDTEHPEKQIDAGEADMLAKRKSLSEVTGTAAAKAAWANYMLGVVDELNKLDIKIQGFEACVVSDVPPGAGVSSSAALEMATAKLLARLFPAVGQLDDLALIQVCKRAENNFVGMGCGILDQYSSGMGKSGHLIHLDCRTLTSEQISFQGASFILANSHAPHQLVDGKYDELRKECFAAKDKLKEAIGGKNNITHLRDIDVAALEEHGPCLTESELNRARHIIYENDRVNDAVKGLKDGNLQKLGDAMSASHKSSSNLFGNSCPELDDLRECAEGIEGFLGGRLMGGGFGGCTINLVKRGCEEKFCEELKIRYKTKRSVETTLVSCVPGDGAFSEEVAN